MNLVWGFDMLIKKHVFLPMSQIYYASRLLNYVIINLLVLLRFLKSLDWGGGGGGGGGGDP